MSAGINPDKATGITPENSRRSFIRNIAIAGASVGAGLISQSVHATSKKECSSGIATNSRRKLGELEVSPVGLGCMSMSSSSYNPPRSAKSMVPVIRGAIDRGVTFFDTAEVYGPFTNEEIVGQALQGVRDKVVLASKFGFKFENGQRAGRDARPTAIRTAVEGMLKRLQTDRIDLLYLHRVDPNVPIEDIAGTVGELIKEGKARHFGLSEVSPTTLRKAHAEYPVTAVQSEYSIMERSVENQVLNTCQDLGVGFVPWGSVVRGFLADKFNEYSRFSDDSRFASVPYYTPEAIRNNLVMLDLIRRWSNERGITPAQFSIAWLLAQHPFIVPIPGTTKLHHLDEDLGAVKVKFSRQELTAFRVEIEKLNLVGFRAKDSALTDK